MGRKKDYVGLLDHQGGYNTPEKDYIIYGQPLIRFSSSQDAALIIHSQHQISGVM